MEKLKENIINMFENKIQVFSNTNFEVIAQIFRIVELRLK